MSRHCDICGKGALTGNSITRRGMPKSKGGIGLHTTGISKRRFMPNIQRIRIIESDSNVIRNVCTRCIRSGKVTKA